MMGIEFVPVVTMKQARELAEIAEKIYYDYYLELIGEENVKYMLSEYESPGFVIEQIRTRRHSYYAIYYNKVFCGYFDITFEGRRVILDKIYVSKSYRKKGIAGSVVEHIENIFRPLGMNKIIVDILTENTGAFSAYEKLGFVKTKDFALELGNGYKAECVEMEKKIG